MRTTRRLVAPAALVMLALSMLLIAGCGSEDAEVSLEGTYWVCTQYAVEGGMSSLLDDTHMDMVFEGVNVSGSSGCNQYDGSYTLDGNSLTIGPLASTMMACSDAIMDQEVAFQAAISSAVEWDISGEVLTLFDDSGTEVAVFEADMSPLTGHAWLCTGYNNGEGGVVSLAADTTITIEFAENEKANGSSGCNTFSAEYAMGEDGSMSFEQIAVTEMYCASPQGIMEQEETFLDALSTVTAYEVRGNSLTLRDGDGANAATFMRQ